MPRLATMGSLFDADDVEFPAVGRVERLRSVRWSYSRRGVLEQCLRRYYYEYYGSQKRAVPDPDKPVLRQLKQLVNRHERAGSHLHQVIATCLRRGRNGDMWDAERLVGWGRELFRRDVDYSRKDPLGEHPEEGRYPPALLQEFFYGLPDAEALCEETGSRLAVALETFRTAASYEWLRDKGTDPEALIEEHIARLELPCSAEGKIDLFCPDGDGYLVVDWKMGAHTPGEESLQLGTYALWACQTRGCAPEQVAVYKAYLGSGDLIPFETTAQTLSETRARILQDAERMAAMHEYGVAGRVRAFTPCLYPNVCPLCAYIRVCREGRECIDDGLGSRNQHPDC